LFFQYYRENANYLERTYDFVERLGIEKVRKDTVYAPEAARHDLRERFRRSKARAVDPWLEGQSPRNPTQFAPIEALEQATVAKS
jgi:nitrite reductase (NADH) large subunit